MEIPREKAPNPDAFTIDFFQAFQSIIHKDVSELIDNSLQTSSFLYTINITF